MIDLARRAPCEVTSNMSRFAPLKWPILLLLGLALPVLFWGELFKNVGVEIIDQSVTVLRYGVMIALCLAGAWATVRLLEVLFWQGLVAPRLDGKVPKLLKDVVAAIVFLFAITVIIGGVFELPVTGLWATSGVVGLVVGFALQSMIADVFSGIALNVDRPFRIGDWVILHPRGVAEQIGEVVEINWRSTRVRKKEGVLVVVPNGLVSTMMLTNLSQPSPNSRFSLTVCLDFGVPVERALRILNAGVMSAEGLLKDPKPKVRIADVNKWGIEYEIRYWLNPVATSPSKGRHAVAHSVLDHLHHAGLTLAYEKQDLYVASMPPRQLDTRSDRAALLSRVELFRDLSDDERGLLGAQLIEQRCGPRRSLVKAGDAGSSMYILVEGLLEVYALGPGGAELRVGQITPGQFFGEMSLLTGEPRSATVRATTSVVVYEITKDNLSALLDRRPEIAEQIALVVAERRVRTAESQLTAGTTGEIVVEAKSFAKHLLGKMRKLFKGLGDEA